MSTIIASQLAVDPALSMNANYDFSRSDRRYIDDQIRAIEQLIVDNLINGRHASWFTLSGASAAVVAGDIVCLASVTGLVTKGLTAALTNANSALGVVIQAASPGGKVLVCIGGILSSTITGLSTTAGFVRANGATGRCERVASFTAGDYEVGTVDAAGWLHVLPGKTTTSAVTAASSDTFTNKTIVLASNTVTDTSAAVGDIARHNGTRFVRLARGSANQVLTVNGAGTDIAWAAAATATAAGNPGELQYNNAGVFGGATNVKAGSGFISFGAGTVSGVGAVRLDTGAHVILGQRNSGGTGDLSILETDAFDVLYIGSDSAFTTAKTVAQIQINGQTAGSVTLGLGGTAQLVMASGLNQIHRPVVGYAAANSVWGAVDGISRIVVSTVNITLTAAQYSRHIQKFTGAPAATRTITYPLPAFDDECYVRMIWPQQTVSTLTITNGGGLTVSLAANAAPKLLLFAQEGVVVLA